MRPLLNIKKEYFKMTEVIKFDKEDKLVDHD